MYYIDLHNDLATIVAKSGRSLKHIFNNYVAQDVKVMVCAIFINNKDVDLALAYQNAKYIIKKMYDKINKSDNFVVAHNYEDIIKAKAQFKTAIIFSLEGGEPIENDESALQEFYDLGVKIVGLTWSRKNSLATGSVFSQHNSFNIEDNGGITQKGKQVLKNMEKLNMILDLSHINDIGFLQALDNFGGSVFCSHSNARKLCNIQRNLTDEQIIKIKRRNGIIGINGVSMLLSKDCNVGLRSFIEQYKYISAIIGRDSVALGLDISNERKINQTKSVYNIDGVNVEVFDVIYNYGVLNKVEEEMKKVGISQNDIELFFYKNAENFLAKCF
ncbi:MAG: membrane dipeptidase [Clostridia bacterium]